MYVASVTDAEIRLTLEATFELANDAVGDDPDLRAVLVDAGFSRAAEASEASVQRLTARIRALTPFLGALGDLEPEEASTRISEELIELPITPSIVDHGSGLHIHWTPTTAKFDDQVMADVMMALAHEVCDNGTIRFGRCDADDCDRLFYDATRNRSKRFCNDPRCASRTHTADHRARRRAT